MMTLERMRGRSFARMLTCLLGGEHHAAASLPGLQRDDAGRSPGVRGDASVLPGGFRECWESVRSALRVGHFLGREPGRPMVADFGLVARRRAGLNLKEG